MTLTRTKTSHIGVTRRRVLCGAAAGAAGLTSALGAGRAEAHRRKAAISRVLFNTRTDRLEVMHRIYAHDGEHAVREMHAPAADIRTSDTDRERLAQYVCDRFALGALGAGDEEAITPVALRYVGSEFEAAFLWVYQDAPLPGSATGLVVANRILGDIWPEQENLVNVERGGVVQSLEFVGDAAPKQLLFQG